MFRRIAPVDGRRPRWIAPALVVVLLAAAPVHGQQPAPAAAPAQQAQAQKSPFVFDSDGGVILHFIKADKTADFEMLVAKLKEALAKSEKPERKSQAASWKLFKAAEPGAGGAVMYVSIMHPAVKDADYYIPIIINEAFPTEGQALYKTYLDVSGNPSANKLTLTLLQDLSK
jgi:hypothetical protein